MDEPLMNIAKEEQNYCFDDNIKRVEATIKEFGFPVAIGSLAAQLADAFEAGYAAAVFDALAVSKGTGDSSSNFQ